MTRGRPAGRQGEAQAGPWAEAEDHALARPPWPAAPAFIRWRMPIAESSRNDSNKHIPYVPGYIHYCSRGMPFHEEKRQPWRDPVAGGAHTHTQWTMQRRSI